MRTTTNMGLVIPEDSDTILGDITALGDNFTKIDGLIWRGTQAQYDALETKYSYVRYMIEEA